MDIDLSNSLKRCLSAPIINNILPGVQRQMTSTQTTNTSSRDATPSSVLSNFPASRTRRYSASFSPLAGSPGSVPRLTPRVSQLRQEECADISNSREVNHEREIHSALQMSQSWEDLTLDTENLSFRNDDITNPLHVTLPTGPTSCSSPSPTRNSLKLPYGLSPSPTRKTFATRRSMSPIAMRPSSLGPVKRKFDMDDNQHIYSPPLKKIFSESRGPSPICQSPLPICPSPDSSSSASAIYGYNNEGCGRSTTPKLFLSKLYTTNSSSSFSSLPPSPVSSCSGNGGSCNSVGGISGGGSSSNSNSGLINIPESPMMEIVEQQQEENEDNCKNVSTIIVATGAPPPPPLQPIQPSSTLIIDCINNINSNNNNKRNNNVDIDEDDDNNNDIDDNILQVDDDDDNLMTDNNYSILNNINSINNNDILSNNNIYNNNITITNTIQQLINQNNKILSDNNIITTRASIIPNVVTLSDNRITTTETGTGTTIVSASSVDCSINNLQNKNSKHNDEK